MRNNCIKPLTSNTPERLAQPTVMVMYAYFCSDPVTKCKAGTSQQCPAPELRRFALNMHANYESHTRPVRPVVGWMQATTRVMRSTQVRMSPLSMLYMVGTHATRSYRRVAHRITRGYPMRTAAAGIFSARA